MTLTECLYSWSNSLLKQGNGRPTLQGVGPSLWRWSLERVGGGAGDMQGFGKSLCWVGGGLRLFAVSVRKKNQWQHPRLLSEHLLWVREPCMCMNSRVDSNWCEELTYWKRSWCWERLKAGEGDDRGWDGWTASSTWWTWVWVNSRSWWWTGRPGVLQSMGSQRVGHDWETELNWTEGPVASPWVTLGESPSLTGTFSSPVRWELGLL